MGEFIQLKPLITSILYSFLGVLILLVSFYIVEKITPENLWEEVIKHKNTAVAIIGAAYILAIAIIIASAMH
jgi:putative membrane protein